ncbi:MAG TPA: hypothetical protein ENJ34_02430, partial [Epsilonproteobacteria bacterium]|nr:hypothetical protein [Campylobacterota bacterium]
GGAGDDTYIFNRGDGHDTIYDYDRFNTTYAQYNAGNDTLQFGSGITVDDLILINSGNDLLVGLRETGVDFDMLFDKIIIRNWDIVNNRIETFKFDNNVTWDVDTILLNSQ